MFFRITLFGAFFRWSELISLLYCSTVHHVFCPEQFAHCFLQYVLCYNMYMHKWKKNLVIIITIYIRFDVFDVVIMHEDPEQVVLTCKCQHGQKKVGGGPELWSRASSLGVGEWWRFNRVSLPIYIPAWPILRPLSFIQPFSHIADPLLSLRYPHSQLSFSHL